MANKRQRSDYNEPDYHQLQIAGGKSTVCTTRQHPRKKTSQMLTSQPPLETIPSTLVDLQRIIYMGGCPRCGRIDAHKTGRIRGGTVQKYRCKHCKCYYHECWTDHARKEARLTPDIFQDYTLEGKERLITLAKHACKQITKIEMNQEEKIFQSKIKVMHNKLVEKRTKVSKLLGLKLPVALEEEEEDNDNTKSMQRTNNNNNIDGEKNSEKIDGADNKEGGGEVDSKSTNNNNNNNSVDPFRDAILLLRNETSQLEQRMFAYQQRQEQIMAKAREEEEEVDILNDNNSPPQRLLGGTYQLTSKIVQEGGEEITIYEKK